MENSTSLRFLEASGRPSGTGRPSLTSPRADQERAGQSRKPARSTEESEDAAREKRELRRKSHPHAESHEAAQAAQPDEPKPFDEHLEGAKGAPSSDARASDGESAETAQPKANEPAQESHDTKPAKSDTQEPDANPLLLLPGVEPKAPLSPLTALAGLVPAGAKAARPTSDAPEVAATQAVAAGSSPANETTPEAVTELPAGLELLEAAEAPSALPSEHAAARDASLAAEPLSATQALPERVAALEAKAPPAPPPPADTERAGEILRQMRVQLSPELRTATIQLSPPELGRISIRMRVERGELRAHVRAERLETLQALERHVPELKATLESIGIQAREIDLQLGFEQRGARQQPSEPGANGASGSAGESDSRVHEHERRLARTLAARTGGIDTYA